MSSDDSAKGASSVVRFLFGSVERVFLLVFVFAYLMVGLFTLSDYGLTWDEAWENHYGDKTLNYLSSFDSDHLDFRKRTVSIYDDPQHPDFYDATTLYGDNDLMTNPHLVWPLAPLLSSVCKYTFFKVIPLFSAIDAHHLAPLLGGLALALGVFAFSYWYYGRWAAIIATLSLTLHPRWYAHCHFNSKDVLSAVFFSFTIFAFYHAMAERRVGFYYISSAMCGFALATKANALFLPVIVVPYVVAELIVRRNEARERLEKRAVAGSIREEGGTDSAEGDGPEAILSRKELIAWVFYPVIAIAVMFLFWPLLWQDFPDNAVKYIESLMNRGYSGETSTWNLYPLRYALGTLPLVYFLFLLMGLRSRILRKDRLNPINLLLLLWLIVPVARVVVPGAKDFDGIRHWLEWVPAMALLAGAGGGGILVLLKRALEKRNYAPSKITMIQVYLAISFFIPLTVWLVRNHPYQLMYFNPVVGGLSGAQRKGYPDATDYWGSSYRMGVRWLNENSVGEKPFVVVGVAEHLAFYHLDTIFADHIRFAPSQIALRMMAAEPERPVYMMRIMREFSKRDIVRVFAGAPIVHEIKIDGVTILEIRRFDNYREVLKANGRWPATEKP